jgi:predicted nucleic acid-binding protein
MQYLLDTGILLRLIHRADPQYNKIRAAVRQLKSQGHSLVAAPQNLAEFWNVCTRPTTARGGRGLSVEATERRVRLIEWMLSGLLPDSAAAYPEWRRLVLVHSVMGAAVHDARLVALMTVHRITHIVTLNPNDFRRYTGLVIVTPDNVLTV